MKYTAQDTAEGWAIMSADSSHRIFIGRGHERRVQAEAMAAALSGDWEQARFLAGDGSEPEPTQASFYNPSEDDIKSEVKALRAFRRTYIAAHRKSV